MIAMPRGAQIAARRSSSVAVTNDPVGLFGLTTSTRARARRDRALDAGEVDRPATVHVEIVGRAVATQIEARQMIEQRIARPRHQHLVAGVRQQLEQQRVAVAGAGGQHDALGRARSNALPRVVGRDRATRASIDPSGDGA